MTTDQQSERDAAQLWILALADVPPGMDALDIETCQWLSGAIRYNKAGIDPTRGEIVDFILGPSEVLLHGATCRTIAEAIRAGEHLLTSTTTQDSS